VDEQPAESGFLPANDLAAIQTGAEQPPPAAGSRWLRRRGGGDDGAGGGDGSLEDQPTESGVLPEDRLTAVRSELEAAPLAAGLAAAAQSPGIGATLFHPQEQSQIRDSWRKIMRWSREFKVMRLRRPGDWAQAPFRPCSWTRVLTWALAWCEIAAVSLPKPASRV
jgi:hypothetical protein